MWIAETKEATGWTEALWLPCDPRLWHYLVGRRNKYRADPTNQDALGRNGPCPRPTDLELWSAGQLTIREQLAAAEARWAMQLPLQHRTDRYMPQEFDAERDADDGEAGAIMHEIMEDDPRAVHISVWTLSPYFEAEMVDMAVPFPISEDYLGDIIKDTVQDMPMWLDTAISVTPQPREDFGTFVLVPSWLAHTDKVVIVIDAEAVQKGVFAIYVRHAIDRSLRQIEADEADEVDVFAFGLLLPFGHVERRAPQHGGLVKVLPRGAVCEWASDLNQRLA